MSGTAAPAAVPVAGTLRLQAAVLVLLAVATALSYVGADHVFDLHMHHLGTLVCMSAMVWSMRTTPLTNAAFLGVASFLFLHVLGAHWLYSFVPYDRWTDTWLGFKLSERFGWERNHYDRLIHLSFGLLVTAGFRELIRARTRATPGAVRFFAFATVLAGSALYEIVEWFVATLADPAAAENYNGQQGDVFDPQKDSALAALGAAISTLWSVIRGR